MSDRSKMLIDDARAVELEPLELDPADIVGGSPVTSSVTLLEAAGVEIGVWQITSGIVVDTEVDEVFVVLSGRARIELADGTGLLVEGGSVVRLAAGERTTWVVYETLRKVYVLLPTSSSDSTASSEGPI